MGDKPLYDILDDMGLSTIGEPDIKLVRLVDIYNKKEYRNYISQIKEIDLVRTDSKVAYFSSEAAKFFYETFNFGFKSQFEEVVHSESDVKTFEKAFTVISELFDIVKNPDTFNLEDEILNEWRRNRKLGSIEKLLRNKVPKSLLKSHFDSYFKKDHLRSINRMGYDKLIDRLYASFTFSRLRDTKTEIEVLEVLNHQTQFAILSVIMEYAGIYKEDLITEEFPQKLREFLNDNNNIQNLRKLFTSDTGKQLVLNSFLASFLAHPRVAPTKLISITTLKDFGFIQETAYNLNRLSRRVSSIWDSLVLKVESDPELKYSDLWDTNVYDTIKYDPNNENSLNNFQLEYNGIKFYSQPTLAGRLFDGLGIIEFTKLGVVLITEIKSTMLNDFTLSPFRLIDGLSNDGVSASILSLSILESRFKEIRDFMVNPMKAEISVVAPILSLKNEYSILAPFETPETEANVRRLLKSIFSKMTTNLNHKLEDHELFLIKVINKINSEISTYNNDNPTSIIGRSTITQFIDDLFKDNDFKTSIKTIAKSEFSGPYFMNELLTGSGLEDLNDIIQDNLVNLIFDYEYSSGGITSPTLRLSLAYEYGPHFKLPTKLSILDFADLEVFGEDITTDQELQDYIKENGALTVYHKITGQIVLVPIGLIEKRMYSSDGSRIYAGFKDEEGVVHTNIFVADDEGYKLASKFVFSASEYRIHSNKYWAHNEGFTQIFEADRDLYLSTGISIFRANYYEAYTKIRGETVITVLREVNLNIEHIDHTPQPLPNLDFKFKVRTKLENEKIIPRKKSKMIPEVTEKIAGAGIVFLQLSTSKAGPYVMTTPLVINNNFLNYLNEEKDKYSISKFKNILYRMGLKDSHFTQLTRGRRQSDGTFQTNSVNKKDFYSAWCEQIKTNLQLLPPQRVFDIRHSGILSISTFAGTDEEYAMIDAALIDTFGYPAFVSLLAGIMTFIEDSSQSLGYDIQFLNHPQDLQSDLLRDFVGMGLYSPRNDPIVGHFLSNLHIEELAYWTGIFTFGFKRKTFVTPTDNFFIENYFDVFDPASNVDYLHAQNYLIEISLSKYLGEAKKVRELNKMNIKGRQEIFEFLYKFLDSYVFPYPGQKTWLANKLMQQIITPTSSGMSNDPVSNLYRLGKTRSSVLFKLGSKYYPATVSFEVNEELLNNAFLDGMLTANTAYTWLFSGETVNNRKISAYYNDFNLIWYSERRINGKLKRFDERLKTTYTVLEDMINKIPKSENGKVKVQFYSRTEQGIDANLRITDKPEGIHTDFTSNEFVIDLNNPSESIVSILFWMMMEPNIVSVLKWDNNIFLATDIYNLLDEEDFRNGPNPITNAFIWDGSNPDFTIADFEDFKETFDAQFEYGDILHFLGFHNHELNRNFDNIIDYIEDKVRYFFSLAVEQFGENSKIKDLR